jgi:hypothetical protein
MTRKLSSEEIRYLRLRAQHLVPERIPVPGSVTQLLGDICGVQAQEPAAAALAVRARSKGLVAADVEQARISERSIMRTWCMRGTLHLLAAHDQKWLLSLHGQEFIRKSQRRYEELGLSEEICVKAMGLIHRFLLNEGPLTRAELAEKLSRKGIPTEGQAAYHLMRRAALEGVICFGPDNQGESTYVLIATWLRSDESSGYDDAIAKLARRYLEAYGPARPDDMATWSGLSMTKTREGFKDIKDELLEVDSDAVPYSMLKSQLNWLDDKLENRMIVNLLPSYDPYLLGYRGRDLIVPKQFARQIHPGGGLIRPTLLVNGVAAGTWRTKRRKSSLEVIVEPFEILDNEVFQALEEEVHDLGRFLQVSSFATIDLSKRG